MDAFEERAAIAEHDSGLSRSRAEDLREGCTHLYAPLKYFMA